MANTKENSIYTKILTYLIPTLLVLSFLSYKLSKNVTNYLWLAITFILVALFFVLLLKTVFKRIPIPTENEVLVFQNNKSLPTVNFSAKPRLIKRISFYLFPAFIVTMFIINYSVALLLSLIFLPVILIFVFLVGMKPVSNIEFSSDGISFYPKKLKHLNFGIKYFIPYEKCSVGWLSGPTMLGYDESFTFFKGKLPYITVSYKGWGESWVQLTEEVKKRIPETRLTNKINIAG
jgi:hypothetical protein